MTESALIASSGVGSMAMMMAETKVRKTREGKPKSRNGCRTCKLRRVKCDETKPHCMRCTRFGQRCDGYITRTPSKASLHITTTRTLAPRESELSPNSNPRSENSSESPNSSHQLTQPSANSSVFQSQQEYDAFYRFCEKSSRSLSRIPSEKWASLVLQACERSPSIRYAVTSIGSLEEANLKCSHENVVGTLQHQSAYGQFKQSTCSLRRGFGGELYDFRSTLTGCLLFFCFDGFRPCRALPIERVLLGLRQLRDWASNAHGIGDRKEPLASSDLAEVDAQITRTFRSLEVLLMTHVDENDRRSQDEYLQMGRPGSEQIPSTFQNVEDARASLEIVIRRSMYWLRNSLRIQRFPSEDKAHEESSEFYGTDARYDDKGAILGDYARWDASFQPLLNFARSKSSSEENFLRASLLRLHWLSGFLSISSNSSKLSIVNNKRLTNELEELISISTLLLKKCEVESESVREVGSMFEFDMQIIVPIMAVGWTCRHRTLRKEALELLSRSSRKEGAWDGVVIGKAMSWLVQMEEEGLGVAEQHVRFIPESAVARGIKMSFDMERRLAMVSCLQPVQGAAFGESRERQIEIPW